MKFTVQYQRVVTTTGEAEIEAPSVGATYDIFQKMEEDGEFNNNDEDLWSDTVEITEITNEDGELVA